MQADFSRGTFDPLKHFSAVLAQQGRVQLDADANEQAAILLHQLRTVVADLVGPAAAVAGPTAGFTIEPVLDSRTNKVLDLTIAPGRFYVDGRLVENHRLADAVTYWNQPDGYLDPDADTLPETGPFVVYLRVWERLITALQDPAIREVALGDPGPDTAARAKTVWQVAWCAGESVGDFSEFRQSLNPERGRLAARAKRPDDADADICHLPPEARFRGPENQLYRVEVHTGGLAWPGSGEVVTSRARRAGPTVELAGATFKWSRENASVVFPVVSVSGATVTLATLGRDGKLDLDIGDHVELADDATASRTADDVPALQWPRPAPKLLTVVAIDPADRLVTLDSEVDDRCGPGTDPELHPLLRRWDHRSSAHYETGTRTAAADGALPLVEDTWIDLEDGVQVLFEAPPRPTLAEPGPGGSYRRGDYWQIPARTITGDVEWPQDGGGPSAVVPHGVGYHYAVLGIVGADGQVTEQPISFEPLFPDPAATVGAGSPGTPGTPGPPGSPEAGGSAASGEGATGSAAVGGGSGAPVEGFAGSPAAGPAGFTGAFSGSPAATGSAMSVGAFAGSAEAGGRAVGAFAGSPAAAGSAASAGGFGGSPAAGPAGSTGAFSGSPAATGSAMSVGAFTGSPAAAGSAAPAAAFRGLPTARGSATSAAAFTGSPAASGRAARSVTVVAEGPPVPQMAFSRPLVPLGQSAPQPSVTAQGPDDPAAPQLSFPAAGPDGPAAPRPVSPSPVPRQDGPSAAQPAAPSPVPGQEDPMPSQPTTPTADSTAPTTTAPAGATPTAAPSTAGEPTATLPTTAPATTAPTTAPPTTAAPTAAAPTAAAPTAAAPTAAGPTAAGPTTAAPTTTTPTTAPPVTGGQTGVLGNQLTSWLRTVVPGLWATLVAWLVSLGLPASMTDWLGGLGNQLIVPVVLAVVYALLRRLEPTMPPWLTRLLIGSNRPPSYSGA
ncbi:DUF6519 domain-containing protein [Amycolatopsis sp. NBC_00345]|uniref:DUF6519 domain-containing protein n=1 Tax=Amycolatopsis sp. NBC_00345 TaxID=2975955 RepID=UPI002E25E7A4